MPLDWYQVLRAGFASRNQQILSSYSGIDLSIVRSRWCAKHSLLSNQIIKSESGRLTNYVMQGHCQIPPRLPPNTHAELIGRC